MHHRSSLRGSPLPLSTALFAALALPLGGCGDDAISTASGTATTGSSTGEGTTDATASAGTGTTAGTTTTGTASASATGTSTSTSTSSGETSSSGTTTDDTTTTGTTGETTTTGTTGDTTTTGTTGDTTTGGDELAGGYVGMSLTDSLVAFDLMTEEAVIDIDLLPEGNYPYDVTIRPDGSEVWVVGAVGDGVKVIDTATQTVTQSIDLAGVGEYAVDVLFNSDGSLAYVSSRDSEALVIIDAETYTIQDTIPLPAGIGGGKMTLDPCTDLVYMVEWFEGSLMRIDVEAKKIDSAPLGKSLWDLRITADGKTLYVTDRGTDQVRVVDAETLTETDLITVGDDPWGIELAEDEGILVIACEDDSTVHLVNTGDLSTLEKPLPMGARPRDVDVLGNAAYVVSGDVLGNDGVYKLIFDADEATFIDLGDNYNSNAIAVRPQQVTCKP